MENIPDCLRCCCAAVRLPFLRLQQTGPFQGNIWLLQGEVSKSDSKLEGDQDRVYLDLTPVKSFLHCAGKKSSQTSPLSSPSPERAGTKAAPDSVDETTPVAKDAEPCGKVMETSEQVFNWVWGQDSSGVQLPTTSSHLLSHLLLQKQPEKLEPEELPPQTPPVKTQAQQQTVVFPQTAPELPAGSAAAVGSPQLAPAHRPKMPLPGEWGAGSMDGGLRVRALPCGW